VVHELLQRLVLSSAGHVDTFSWMGSSTSFPLGFCAFNEQSSPC